MATSTTIKKLSLATTGAAFVALGAVGSAEASTLWYNGDFDYLSGKANEINTAVTNASTYDDFTIPEGQIWNIDTIWSNNLMNFTGVTQSAWSIRKDVSAGNGGTVVASGTSAATQTATGRNGFGFNEYNIQLSGLNINLDAGTYWLSVTPIGFGSGRSFNSNTSGLNAVGTFTANTGNSFLSSSYFGTNFQSQTYDYSKGIAGVAKNVPEPTTTLGLLALGAMGAGSMLKRKQQQKVTVKA